MTISITLLFGIILLLIIMLIFEVLPSDTLAVALMVVLMVCGFVTPQEGISGLSNQATVTVLALMILSVGLETTGVITSIGKRIKLLFERTEWVTILVLMLIVGTCSAFISTTAVVIVFLRIMIKLSQKMPANLAKILMPLSFAGIMGGSCTLLGTSTNLLVSAIAKDYKLEPFGVFEFTPIGVIFFVAGLAYMVLIGRHLIPNRTPIGADSTRQYAMEGYLTEIVIPPDSNLIGKRIDETIFYQDEEINFLEIKQRNSQYYVPNEVLILQEDDLLLVKASVEKIAELHQNDDVRLLSRQMAKSDQEESKEKTTLCEVIVRPSSRLIGKSLNRIAVKKEYNALPLAIKKHKLYYFMKIGRIKVESSDTVLMEVEQADFEQFYNLPDFVVLQEHEDLSSKSDRRYIAAIIMVAVILLAATNVLPILVSALSGCVAMFLTGCLDLQKAYRRVDWSVFFLLAGVIPLGIAMDNTGASQLIASTFVEVLGEVSPRILVSILFIFTALLSGVISNNATAILIAPIAVSIATSLQIDPRPLLFTVMFAASASYISPIGYQTNTLIYGPGGYKFADFVKVGGGLMLLIWGLATLLIPMFYF
ncbi:MAG: SLC13 family permease [Chitinophagales bacterium]